MSVTTTSANPNNGSHDGSNNHRANSAVRAKAPSKKTRSGAKIAVSRQFTSEGDSPFAAFRWVTRQSRIANPDGTAVFEMPDVEVPDFWDQVAIDILASKYFRKAGVPQYHADGTPQTLADGTPVLGPERSLKQVAYRLSHAWRIWGERAGYFATEDDAQAYEDEMAYMICTQMAAPNSPQWFNTGLFEAYGIIEDADGNFYFDPATNTVIESAHKYERSAVNACFILSVEDKLVGDGSIMRHIENEARLFKAGSGSGANYSKIREAGAKLTGGGTSSGLMSFLRVHDRAAGAIKSGGTTRRAAKMVIVDADHPDIEEFIWCKVEEERKVAALVAGGYSSDFNGEAYDTVAYQNANHSVRLPEGFMQAVAADEDFSLLSRRDGSAVRTLKARELFDKINLAAWHCADPGVQFDDLLNDWNTVADTQRIRGSNPCSEYVFADDTACNLASLNLVRFLDSDGVFDTQIFTHAVRLWTITLEISVSMSHYPTAEVARRSYLYRTLGLGYANMGALLMRGGLPYDSDKGRSVIAALTALMHNTAYATSSELAAAVGAFAEFSNNESSMLRVLRNHRRAAYGSLAQNAKLGDFENLSIRPQVLDHLVLAHTPFAHLSKPVLAAADEMISRAELHGVRNAQVTVLAPTGTIGLVMGCDTTGVEPDFALVKLKKLSGGGYMRIVNQSVIPALRNLGYTSAQIERIETHMLGTQSLDGDTPVCRTTLVAAGLDEFAVSLAASQLASVSDLTWAFSPFTLGAEVFERLGLDPNLSTGADLLARLGFLAEEVSASSRTICGNLTVEGAPDLRPEHLAVFDCAVECGNGTRVISWEGHVKALGAASPHLSGAISKTVNMPNSATPDDVAAAYTLGYEQGVKCVAIYRDGSKLSQPLNSASSATAADESDGTPVLDVSADVPVGVSPAEFYGGTKPPRFRLPNMRFGPRWRVEVGGEELYIGVGEYPDGTLGEVFIDWGKQGSTLRGVTAALSITISQALQHGVPLERIVKALRGHTFEPRGVVVGHGNVKMATSIIDAVVRILGYYYLADADLVQMPTGPTRAQMAAAQVPAASALPTPSTPAVPAPLSSDPEPDHETASAKSGERVYGQSCSACGSSNMIKAGSCSVCGDCGTTTGCS